MARVYVVRHAKAAPGEPDELRPLTPAGREQARAVGRRLARGRPAAVLTGPLLRAKETAELIAEAAGIAAEADDRLAPGADATAVRAAVAGRGDVVIVVCHQPDCGRIAVELGGGPEPPFPPAGVHAVDIES